MINTVDTRNHLYRIINVYRPEYSKKHKVTINTFFKEFTELLDDVVHLPGLLIITGDFNIHIESCEESRVLQFMNLLEEYSLYQIVTGRTHQNGGLIDLVITSEKKTYVMLKYTMME